MQNLQQHSRDRSRGVGRLSPFLVAAFLFTSHVQGEVTVQTLGGGPLGTSKAYGKTDGHTADVSQFNGPSGLALDSNGTLFLADKTNNLIRRISVPGDTANSQTTTYLTLPASSRPVGVAVDATNNLYVLTQTEGRLRRYNANRTQTNTLSSTLSNPTALALDTNNNVFVTQLDGTIHKITPAGVKTQVASGFNQPRGIAVLENGLLAISDTGNNSIRLVNPANGNVSLFTGGNGAGFTDGPSGQAQFNQPYGITRAPDGTLLVADRGNHRVRLVNSAGAATTLYGIDPSQWDPSYYPGWANGNTNMAASRDPVATTVSPNGTVFVTEFFYHLLRSATGAILSPTNGGSGTNPVVIAAPTVSPNSGYFPGGKTIAVSSVAGSTYFTTDGSEPTTSSTLVVNGMIDWRESLRDLSSLRVKTFNGTNSSVTTSGQFSAVNEIGIPGDLSAGPGSTVVVPVVINLRSNDQLRSIQFRVEVSPNLGAPPISEEFRALSVTSNDFVSMVTPSAGGTNATVSVAPYSIGAIRGLTVAAVGTGANYLVKPFAVTALLAVPIPAGATENQSYQIQVLNASGTTDGLQNNLPLTPIAARTITVATKSYLVGDTSPGGWFNAGDFGDGKLFNSDVNNAFYASFGIRLPFDFTDAFDAMDVGRPGRPDSFGGDGLITSYDWQRIYQRSLGLETVNWARTSARDADGNHIDVYQTNGNFTTFANRPSAPAKASAPVEAPVSGPGTVWLRHAVVGGGSTTNVGPGGYATIPVYVKVTPGYSLAGLQFRATLLPQAGAPAPGGIEFLNPIGSNFRQEVGTSPNDIVCSWSMAVSSAFSPQLQGSNLLGYVRFQIPGNASSGQSYKLRFSYTDGAPNFETAYDFENLSGFAWVQSAPLTAPEVISDEWKTRFFGSATHPSADAGADPDNDGFTNFQENQAGTNPTNALSRLQFSHSEWRNTGTRGIALQWLSAPGKIYVIEGTPSLTNPNWTSISTSIGDGNSREFFHTDVDNGLQFFRVRVQP